MSKKKQYYFMYNGERIETGRVLKFKPWKGCVGEHSVEEITFEWYVPEMDLYVFKYTSTYGTKGYGMYGNKFKEYLIGPTNKTNEYVVKEHQMRMENNKLTFAKELQIDSMFLAWMWYIVLMGITFIFNGFYFYWAVISFCFFIYRYGKLKEEGYK